MSNSSPVNPGDTATAASYNSLRSDVLDPATGHAHTGGTDGTKIAPMGLTGATAATRYVGATASGAPASGTFAIGDFVIDQTGKVWVCTVAGTSGTWVSVGGTVGVVGWAPVAHPLGHEGSASYTGATTNIAASGGSVAVPIWVPAAMQLQSISFYIGTNVSTTELRLYKQTLNSGNVAQNVLDEVPGANSASAAVSGSATNTRTVTGAPVYLDPGLYWLVLRVTGGTVLSLGSLAGGGFSPNRAQTKTLGSALGATLDFVAATWTKVTTIWAVRLDGRVFGETTAY